jgi:hypothetical protein
MLTPHTDQKNVSNGSHQLAATTITTFTQNKDFHESWILTTKDVDSAAWAKNLVSSYTNR